MPGVGAHEGPLALSVGCVVFTLTDMHSNPVTTPTRADVVQSRSAVVESTATRPIRVFLVDDHEVARIDSSRPDVAVVDLFLPDGDGVQVCREVRSRRPELHCLILTSFSDDEALFDARQGQGVPSTSTSTP